LKFLPADNAHDAAILIAARGSRGLIDGLVATILPTYLVLLGFSSTRIGAVITAMLLGSAAMTLALGFIGYRMDPTTLFRFAALLMVLTGVGFIYFDTFWPIMIVGLFGTLNPSSGDVSIFLPMEQSRLSSTTSDANRTALFARYTLVGFVAAALGSLFAGGPEWLAQSTIVSEAVAYRLVFVIYGFLGIVIYVLYSRLHEVPKTSSAHQPQPLGESRKKVMHLAVLFSLDSFGGGFVIQALVVLWLQRKFDLSLVVAGTIFFWTGLLSGLSGLVAVRIAQRVGLIRTMVLTHIPANIFLITAVFMPNVWLAVVFLVARSALSQMDVPTRTSYVMSIVSPGERAAAASITNVPRSLAGALPPLAAGWMLDHTTFGWPLLIGGATKIVYDLLLLRNFRHVRPPEEKEKLASRHRNE